MWNEGDIKYLEICIANNYKSKVSGELWNGLFRYNEVHLNKKNSQKQPGILDPWNIIQDPIWTLINWSSKFPWGNSKHWNGENN